MLRSILNMCFCCLFSVVLVIVVVVYWSWTLRRSRDPKRGLTDPCLATLSMPNYFPRFGFTFVFWFWFMPRNTCTLYRNFDDDDHEYDDDVLLMIDIVFVIG